MKKTKLMAILNVTPDSFFDKGSFFSVDKAIEKGIELYKEGADILDIGGESTRPGSDPVSEEEELNRILPVIEGLKNEIPIPISIDTMKFNVAKKALQCGATWINDVTGFQSSEMIELAKETSAPIIVMHMLGTPKTMQIDPVYKNGVIEEILQFFEMKTEELIKKGIKTTQIILDPGIGFGKSIADNLKIIHNLDEMKKIGFPLLVGLSRKSFMGKIVNKTADLLLPATIGLNSILIASDVDIIRVHDVKEHRMLIDIMDKYLEVAKKA